MSLTVLLMYGRNRWDRVPRGEFGTGQSILGHSFGGYLAIRYAREYPRYVERPIIEIPSFDLGGPARTLLNAAAGAFELAGDSEHAEPCRDAAAGSSDSKVMWESFSRLGGQLGARRNNFYVHGAHKDFYEDRVARSGLPSELWGRGATFQDRLIAEAKIFEPVV